MNAPESELDEHLRALFGGLDTGADFEGRLLAHLRAVSQADAIARTERARQQEQARYVSAISELRSWRRSMLGMLTLDTLGIAFLLTFGVVTAWPYIREAFDAGRHYGPHLAILFAILIGTVPVLGVRKEQVHRPFRLL